MTWKAALGTDWCCDRNNRTGPWVSFLRSFSVKWRWRHYYQAPRIV